MLFYEWIPYAYVHYHIINFFLLLMKACACVAVCPRAALVAKSVCPSCRRLAMSGSNEVQVLLLEVCLTGDTHLSNSLSTDGAKLQLGNIISLDALHVCNSQTSECVPFRQRGLLQRPKGPCTNDVSTQGGGGGRKSQKLGWRHLYMAPYVKAAIDFDYITTSGC